VGAAAAAVAAAPRQQVLRIIIQAEGPNGAWFRPREAVVQRVVRKEGDGVYVVLFSSIDSPAAAVRDEGVCVVALGRRCGGSGRFCWAVRLSLCL
jgi:hypothetical protein